LQTTKTSKTYRVFISGITHGESKECEFLDWQSLVPFIPFFATFFGVLTAFLIDRWRDRLKKGQTARQLISYIYLEIQHNLRLVEECLHRSEFFKESKRFDLSHWEMFKAAFMDLSPVHFPMLTRTYYYLAKANRQLDAGAEMLDANLNLSATIAGQLTKDLLKEFDTWFQKDKKAMKAKEEVERQWQVIGKYDTEIRQSA
jgi:hypothetical protein